MASSSSSCARAAGEPTLKILSGAQTSAWSQPQQSDPSEPGVTAVTHMDLRFTAYSLSDLWGFSLLYLLLYLCAICRSRNTSKFFFPSLSLSLSLSFFSFSPHRSEMTHFNGTMKNCNGFSTPTTQPTSRPGRCDSIRGRGRVWIRQRKGEIRRGRASRSAPGV